MTRDWRLSSLIILSILTAVVSSCGRKSGDERTVTIGAVLELTGQVAAYGKAAANGIKLASEELNANDSLSGTQIRVQFEDSGSDASRAVTAITRLISLQNVPVVIGGVTSSTTLAMAPIAENSRVVLFSPGASSPDLTNAGKYIFRNYPSDLYEATVLANQFHHRGISRIALLFATTEYAQGLARAFQAAFSAPGDTIVIAEGYEADQADFRTLTTKLATLHRIDAFYLPGYYQGVGLLLRQLRSIGISTPVYASTGIEDPQFFTLAGSAAEGVIYPTPSIDFQNPPPSAIPFMSKYRSQFGENPNYPALLAYDATMIVASAIKSGGSTADSIRIALHRISNFPGITGLTTIDKNGDAVKPFHLNIVKNNKFVRLQENIDQQ